ncbi:MAG: Lsr2 family protein [Actinomycetota bacterium]|nr:Lsr2 family protein [Actinomycetota bacterium]
MAKRTEVRLVDDLDGSEADETVSFALDGAAYEIDLSSENAAKLRDALALYVSHAQRTTGGGRGGRRRGARRRSDSGTPSTGQMREWARSQGYQVSDRGRVSAEVREAYLAAH